MIEVVPQPDGSLTVKTVYVPDPRQVYYVRAGSILSKYTLDVQTDGRGLLKSVAFAPDSSQVAAKAATAAGEIGKARVEALKAARDKEAVAEAETRKAVEAAARDAAAASEKVRVLSSSGTKRGPPGPPPSRPSRRSCGRRRSPRPRRSRDGTTSPTPSRPAAPGPAPSPRRPSGKSSRWPTARSCS